MYNRQLQSEIVIYTYIVYILHTTDKPFLSRMARTRRLQNKNVSKVLTDFPNQQFGRIIARSQDGGNKSTFVCNNPE